MALLPGDTTLNGSCVCVCAYACVQNGPTVKGPDPTHAMHNALTARPPQNVISDAYTQVAHAPRVTFYRRALTHEELPPPASTSSFFSFLPSSSRQKDVQSAVGVGAGSSG